MLPTLEIFLRDMVAGGGVQVAREKTSGTIPNLSPEGERLLHDNIHHVSFTKPAAVIHKGQRVSGAYLVTSGQLRVFTYTPQGTEATLYFIRAGETCVLALNCLFNDLRYPAWVESDVNTHVAVIPGPVYRTLFEHESVVQDMTVKALSTLVFRLMGELEQIHACTLDQRLANFLLTNATEEGKVFMTQQELAGHLGTTREVIARLMQGFTAQGFVTTRRGAVTIIDAKGLADVIKP